MASTMSIHFTKHWKSLVEYSITTSSAINAAMLGLKSGARNIEFWFKRSLMNIVRYWAQKKSGLFWFNVVIKSAQSEYVASLVRDMGLASIRTSAKRDYRKVQELEKKKNVLQ